MNKALLLILVATALLVTCKKGNFDQRIEGVVTNGTLGGNMSGIQIKLKKQSITSGVFNTNYETVAETTSASDGSYSIDFKRENVAGYKLEARKENYFDRDFLINPDNISPGDVYTRNITMLARADFRVEVENTTPLNNNDVLTYHNLNANFSCDCCDNEDRIYGGTDINESATCGVWGNYWIKYFYQVEKDTVFYAV
jgi:hypothetical protein